MRYQLNSRKSPRSKGKRPIILVLFGILLIVISCFGIWTQYSSQYQPSSPPNPNEVINYSTKTPIESKPKDDAKYIVAHDQPRRIIINSINVAGYIQKVGIDKSNTMAVPTNINFAGWYVHSVHPGDEGLSLIDGHVSGKNADGIFKHINKLNKGDVFKVEFGDYSVKNFEVISSKQLPESEASKMFYFKKPEVVQQLNLITCGGKYNKVTQKFDDRVVVIAKTQ